RNHVAQRARDFVVATAHLHAQFLGNGDLHMIDITPIPHRLEDSVREPEGKKVLDGLLAEVMVDAISLRFFEDLGNGMIQCDGRSQVVSERLFDDHTLPGVVVFGYDIGGAELLYDDRKKLRTDGKIEKAIPFGAFSFFGLTEGCL